MGHEQARLRGHVGVLRLLPRMLRIRGRVDLIYWRRWILSIVGHLLS